MSKRNIRIRKYNISYKQNEEKQSRRKFRLNKKHIETLLIIGVFLVAITISVLVIFRIQRREESLASTEDANESGIINTEENYNLSNTYNDQETALAQPSYLKEYIDISPDTVGYIKIKNTIIDYPVVQTDNNEFYLNHNFYHEKDKAGAIFLDFRCDIDDFSKTRNIIIYGHRMKDGSMFKGLLNYQDAVFFQENRIIQFDTLNGEYEWEVFAVLETTTEFYYIDTDFPYDKMWIEFLNKCKEMSIHQTLMNFYEDDIVLTLSTCTMEQEGRFVVMAKLIQ